jgi:hypothetical protein
MEPEPEPVGGFSGGQKVDNFIKSKTKDHKETSPQGLRGPELQAQLLKRSDHIKEWRSRYFHLHDRRIYYFVSPHAATACRLPAAHARCSDGRAVLSAARRVAGRQECEEDAKPVDGKTFHKGYIDLVGCSVSLFTDEDDNGSYYGFQVQEEYGLPGDGKGGDIDSGHKLRLCSAHEEQRDQWVEYIKEASRPTWLDEGDTKGDPKFKVCLCCQKKFNLKNRKSHCRRCGGVMCKACTAAMELPAMLYTEPQKVCLQCTEGQYASRHILKIPKSQRGNKKPKAVDAAADAAGKMMGEGVKALKGLGGRFGGGKK